METKISQVMKQLNRRRNGANLNLFRYAAMVAMLLMLGIGNAWAGSSDKTYYATMNVTATPTGGGTVYVTSSNKTSDTKSTSSSSSSASISFNIVATNNSGYKFKSWSGSGISFGNTSSASTTGSISTSNQTSPGESKTATATFVKVFQFKAKADFTTGSASGGKVWVGFTNTTPSYQTTAMTVTTTQDGDDAGTSSKTKTVYFNAQAPTGMEFKGWYSDVAGNTLVSSSASYSKDITSSVISEPSTPQLTYYAKFEKVETTPSWALSGIAGTSKTLEIGEEITLVTNTAGTSYSWGTPTYVDAGETNPIMNYNASTKTFTANRAGTVTVTFTQAAGEVDGVLWKAGSQTFTFTVNKCTPTFAWADPLPNFVVGTSLPVSDLFSFAPAESAQNWTLTSDNTTSIPSIAAPATQLALSKEASGVTLTFHQDATWKWKEIANTSITINVTKEPVVFNWKNPALIAGNTYSWTDFVETNSVGAWNLVSEDESVIPTMRSIASTSGTVAAGTVTLTFTQGQDLGHDAVPVQTKTFRVYPADGLATFKVGSTTYADLNAANSAASSGSNKTIVVARDGVLLPGNYTISSGVTLYVPYSTSETSQTTPNVVTTTTALSAYRTLTFTDGANITCESNGVICVGGQMRSGSGGSATAYPTGAQGVMDMSQGGSIVLNNKATLYAWGYIKGQGMDQGNNTVGVGTITAKSGSIVWEDISFGDFRGGTVCSVLDGTSGHRCFPFQSYAIQNIEVPLIMQYGATEKVYTNVYASSQTNGANTTLIASSGAMFLLTDAQSVVKKWYDPTTDLMCYELSGTAQLSSLTVDVSVASVNSASYDLPITSSMHIILSNCTMTLSKPMYLQPGAVVEIKPSATVNLTSNLYVVDNDEWGKFILGLYFKPFDNLTVHKNRGDGSSKDLLDDAKLIVDGTLNVTGSLYTSTGGADIMGNGGGKIMFSTLPSSYNIRQLENSAGGNSSSYDETKHYNGLFGYGAGDVYFRFVPTAAANLHNEDGSYTKSIASKTFHNVHGRWFVADDKDPKADHTYSFKYLDNGNAGTTATTPAVYSSDKTGLMGGYKWMNVALDNSFCGSATYRGIDGHYYYYNSASTDPVSKWVQLVKLNDALYSGSDNNLYTFTTNSCMWASVGEIDENCMYTIENKKMALVGTQFVELEKDEYDEVYVKVTDHSDYYMAFDGCVWQHATKIPDTYKAYEVLDNPYIWLNDEWTQVAEEYGYYYTTDEQNVHHYYEFDDVTFTWKPAKERVRITTPSGDRKDLITWDMAMAYLGQYTNPTVTLLDDALATQQVTTLAPGSKSTEFTFDFNGHTVTANIGDKAYFMNMNTTAKLYITDNSDKGNGQMLIYGNGNKKISGLNVTKGNVVMNGGRIYMENSAVYASNTSCQAAAINLVAGQSVEINDGEIEAKAHRNAVGVYGASSAATATTSKITMNGGKVTATAPNYAYGILSYGIINMNGGTIDAKTEAVTSAGGTTAAGSYAYGIYGHISVSAVDANSYYSTINMTGGTANATAYSSYAYGVFGNSTYTTANGKKSDGTSDNSYKSTDGTYSNKASCKLNITGGVINAVTKVGSYSYGIYSEGTYNSYKDYNSSTHQATITPHVIKNVKIFSQAASSQAYGILMTAKTHEYSGGLLWGEATIDNADVYAETTVSTGAYAVFASATNIWTNRARYSKVSADNKKTWYVQANENDGDVTHEGIAATSKQVYQYQIGCHVAGAKITINSGTYRAKSANSTTAAAVYCSRSVCPGDPTGNTAGVAEVIINGGTFTAETETDTGYGISNGGITTVNGGTINVHTGTSTAYGVYGWAGTLTLNSGVEINSTVETTTAYGVAANGWIDGNTGMHAHGTVIVNDGVIVNATSPNSSTAYGAYALATNAELNQAKYNARSADNKKNYYAVNEEGTTVTNATVANYIPYRFGTYVEGGEITINGGTFNVTTFGSTAIGAGTHYSNLVRTTELGRVKVGRGVLNVHGGTFNVESQTSSTVEGIRSYGITTVDGGTFNLQTKTSTAYGVCARDGKTTIDGGTFNVTAGTSTAVGVSAWADEYDTNYGFGYAGELEVNGGTFNVKTWNGSEAYGVQVRGTTKNFAAAKVVIGGVADTKKDYAIAGTATINGGTFIMTPSNGTKAYSTHVYTTQTLGTATAYPTCYVKGGFFQTNGTTTSGMYVSALKENNVVTGGHFSDNTGLTSTTATKNYVNAPYHVLNCLHPEYKATYPYEVAEAYTITFKDDEDNTLWSGLQPKGSTAVYPLTNGIPEKTATATNSFEFASWNTPLAEVTGDATYIANFTAVAKKFMVTWKDDKGVEIDHMEYVSGATPTHADPVKDGYTFTGWTPGITAVAAADQIYTATFTINQYTIRWEDEDGTLIREDKVNYNVTPTKPSNPTKEGYSFSAWNPGVVKATEDVTYTATYLLNIAKVTTSANKTTYYTAWSSALSAANAAANSTLTVLTDVGALGSQTISQTFTLDLNGHSLSGTANKLLNLNTAGKTLTIRDSQGGGKIETKVATAGQLVAVYVTKGTLNIESGYIRAENTHTTTSASYYACGVLVSSGYACNMSGGTVEGITNIDLAYGLYNNGGTVNITGGTINAQAQTKAYGVHVKGNTTVTNEHDVVINATTTRTTIADAFYVTAAKTLTINGGVFTANALTTAGYAIETTADAAAATINVNGGKFKSSAKTVSNTGGATIHLNAGFYDTDTELAGFASPKQVVALTTEPEKAEGYNYKIVDDAHQITFKNEDGSVVLQQSNIEDGVQPVYYGEAQTKPSTPKYAYSFDGWKDASDDHVYAEAELPVVSKDVVYTAHFAQSGVEYPITFANIDGMGTNHVQMVTYGEVPVYNGATPYMSGAVSNYAYTFIGWDPELAVVEGPATYTPRYNLVISHNVSFVINNPSAVTPTTLTVAEGAAVERPADQLIGCQHIAGWYKDAGLTEEWDFASDKLGESDLILYAKWETKTYTITWLDENADEIDQTTVDCGTVPTHANLTKPSTAACSYEWKGWNKTLVAANADATYKSLGFTQVPKRYAITFVTGSGATVINPIEQEVGSAVVAPADPSREGYTFNGWDPAVPATMPAKDVTCVAQWTAATCTINLDREGGTTGATSVTVTYNTSTLTGWSAPTKTGNDFAGYYTGDDGTGTLVINTNGELQTNVSGYTGAGGVWTKASATTLYAKWTPKTYSFNPIGVTPTDYGSVNHTSITSIPYGSTVTKSSNTFTVNGTTVTATPAATTAEYTYAFSKWNNVPNTVTANVTNITAEFTRTARSYTLTWVTDGDALTGSYTNGTVAYGTAITAPNTPTKAGYVFAGWHNGTSVVTPSTMPAANTTYTAQWTAAVASVTAGGNTTYHATVSDAITAANGKSNPTVTILQNASVASKITISAAMTIDLNGKTITSTIATKETGTFYINASGKTVTIRDNGTGGKISQEVSCSAGYLYGIHLTAGSLAIESGTIHIKNTANNRAYGIYTDGSASSITVSGSAVVKAESSTSPFGIYSSKEGCTLTMNGGTFIANGAGSRGIYMKGATNLTNATITVTGNSKAYAIFAVSGNMTINSGTYTTSGASDNLCIFHRSNTITIKGGYFSTSNKLYTRDNGYSGTITLQGGYYNNNTELEEKCATNYHVLPNADATYQYKVAEAYTVTFKDGDNNTIQSGYVEKGQTPVYSGETPTKTEDANYTYTFNDTWSPAIVEVFAAATYVAQFDAATKATGFYADIVDVNNSTKTLTLNVSGWVTAGWPYDVNGRVYYRDEAKATAASSTHYRAENRTLTIPYTGNPGENFPIVVKNTSTKVVSQHIYVIPQEITSETILTENQNRNLFVKGTTLTINASIEAKNIYVGEDAKLVVNSGKKLTADSLFLRTVPSSAAELENNGTIVANVYYTRIIEDKSGYFQFGLPFDCAPQLSEIRLSDGANPKYATGSGWILRSYDEASRATYGDKGEGENGNWKTLAATATISGGKGYEMYSGVNYYREFYFPVTLAKTNTVAVTRTGDDKSNSGWNMIVSPLTRTSELDPKPEDIVVNWMQPDGSFAQENPTSIAPAKAFAYQAAKAGSIVFEGATMTVPSLVARRRVAAMEEPERIQWIHLDITDADGIGDQTSVYSHPTRYEAAYQTGIDVAKQSLTAARAILYSSHAYGEMAFAGVADSLLEQGVALTVFSPKPQELTISLRDNRWLDRLAEVWLIDNQTGAQIDLFDSDYTFEANEGTTRGRIFLVGRFKAPNIATDIDNTDATEGADVKVQKLIIRDKLYIRINGQLYDATGKKVNDK